MRELSALQRHKVENEKLVKLLTDEKKKSKTAQEELKKQHEFFTEQAHNLKEEFKK